MWRSASSLFLRRCSPQQTQHQRLVSSLVTSGSKNNRVRRIRSRYACRPLSSSGNDDSNKASGKNHDDDSDEEWVPPVRFAANNEAVGDSDEPVPSTTTTPLPKSERIETILEVSRQVKEQERLDRALEESEKKAEALFQLSEEEQVILTDEEILQRLEEVLKQEEELEEEIFQKELQAERLAVSKQTEAKPIATDWLRNRRAMLGEDSSLSSSVVPVTRHALLEAEEIKLLLEEHGGQDVVIVHDDPEAPRMGGAEGMIFCTGGGSSGSKGSKSNFINNSPYLISTLSRVLIDHMKDRKLHELGIAPSSQQNTTNRAATTSPTLYGSGFASPSESWRIVDCGNYIVHILDDATRWDLNLEDLWSGEDPLWSLNVFDEDEVEEYCQRHPVPETYNGTGSSSSNILFDDEEGYMDVAAMKKLERTRFGSRRRHKPVIPQSIKNRDRQIGRKKRREKRERDYFGSFE